MTKVFLWAADWAGCWTYRMRFPMSAIQEGPNAKSFEIDSDVRISPEAVESADVVVGQRVCKDGPSSLWQKWAKKGDRKLVFEMDDDLFSVDPENLKAHAVFNQPNIRANLIANIQASDTVTVSTEPLAEAVRKHTGHSDVRVIPNAVPEWFLEHNAPETYTTGYMGSPTHHRDIKPVARHFRRFFNNNPEATFHSIGFDYGEFMDIGENQRAYTSWVKDVDEALRSLDFSFGVAPLRASVFARSKSDLKALEMAALGRPCVVSNVAPFNTLVDGETALVVKYDHEWPKKLQTMYEDKDLRAELGRNAREWVKTRTLGTVRGAWEAAYSV